MRGFHGKLLAALLAALLLGAAALAEELAIEGGAMGSESVARAMATEFDLAGESAVGAAGSKPSVKLSSASVKLDVGGTKTLTARVTPASKAKSLRFKSSDKKVATVGAKTGKITAKAAGKATISATLGGKVMARCKVTVNKAGTTELFGYVKGDYKGLLKLARKYKLKQKRSGSATIYSNGVLEVMIGDNYGSVTIPAKAKAKYSLEGVTPAMKFNKAAGILKKKGWKLSWNDGKEYMYVKTVGRTEFDITLKKKSGGKLASVSAGFMGM